MTDNALFVYFRESGKYYTEGRGVLTKEVFNPRYTQLDRRRTLLQANCNRMPGLSTTGSNFFICVYGDEGLGLGWHLLLHPVLELRQTDGEE